MVKDTEWSVSFFMPKPVAFLKQCYNVGIEKSPHRRIESISMFSYRLLGSCKCLLPKLKQWNSFSFPKAYPFDLTCLESRKFCSSVWVLVKSNDMIASLSRQWLDVIGRAVLCLEEMCCRELLGKAELQCIEVLCRAFDCLRAVKCCAWTLMNCCAKQCIKKEYRHPVFLFLVFEVFELNV